MDMLHGLSAFRLQPVDKAWLCPPCALSSSPRYCLAIKASYPEPMLVLPLFSLGVAPMSGYLDKPPSHESSRRKLLDQRRMEYRRAIESYAEQRQLQQQLADYPELIAANYLAGKQALARQSAQPAG